jgi:hypothetical protein
MPLHFGPLGLGDDESFHPKLESRQTRNGNPNSQQTLERDDFGLNRIGIPESDLL